MMVFLYLVLIGQRVLYTCTFSLEHVDLFFLYVFISIENSAVQLHDIVPGMAHYRLLVLVPSSVGIDVSLVKTLD